MRENRTSNLLRPTGRFDPTEVVDDAARKAVFREIGRTIVADHGMGDTAMKIMRAMERAFKAGKQIGENPAAFDLTGGDRVLTAEQISPRARDAFDILKALSSVEPAVLLKHNYHELMNPVWRVFRPKNYPYEWGITTISPLVKLGLYRQHACSVQGKSLELLVPTIKGRALMTKGSVAASESEELAVSISGAD